MWIQKRAAISRDEKPVGAQQTSDPNVSWIKQKALGVTSAIYDLLKNPAYAIPLLLNVTGSVWFFLLIGQAGMSKYMSRKREPGSNTQAELSLTVPITNSLAFLFTVLGEWWAEGKVISRG